MKKLLLEPSVFRHRRPTRRPNEIRLASAHAAAAERDKTPLAKGPTYFVDPAKGDDKNDGSEAKPWKSIQHTVNRLKAATRFIFAEARTTRKFASPAPAPRTRRSSSRPIPASWRSSTAGCANSTSRRRRYGSRSEGARRANTSPPRSTQCGRPQDSEPVSPRGVGTDVGHRRRTPARPRPLRRFNDSAARLSFAQRPALDE